MFLREQVAALGVIEAIPPRGKSSGVARASRYQRRSHGLEAGAPTRARPGSGKLQAPSA